VKRMLLLAALAGTLLGASGAEAHPLGNFTINRHSRIELSGDRAYVVYVLDMAEIPTFQARQAGVDPDAYARRIGANLQLTLDGRRARLAPRRRVLAFPKGVGGLRTMRLEILFAGPILGGQTRLDYRDGNYAGRIGWKEIVVRAGGGARITNSTAPAESRSDELRAYPEDLLESPLEVTSATATVEPGAGPGTPPALAGGSTTRAGSGGFASLLEDAASGERVLLVLLLASLAWGALHALSPGHGKAMVAAYLVGTRGTARHAVALGATVTVTHTIGVFALGVITLALSQYVLPEDLYPWLTLISGLMVVGIGAAVLRSRVRLARHAHAHSHSHSHAHAPGQPGWKGILGMGVAAGLIPCPSALVVLLAAISQHEVALGLLLILAFSVGLAATLTVLGLAVVYARRLVPARLTTGRLATALPAGSAVAIVAVGCLLTARAVPGVV
jgi:nickel/cobalt transporter (NicO) family protein